MRVYLLYAVLLLASCNETNRREEKSFYKVAGEIRSVVTARYSATRAVRVAPSLYRGKWYIDVYLQGLLPEEVDEVHKVIVARYQYMSGEPIYIKYLSNVIRVDGQILTRENNTLELLETRSINEPK